MSRDKSQRAFARAKQWMPGGVNSPARAFGAVGGEPIFFERAQGACLYDLDGNRYIDYVGSWGPMILGHAHPQVTAAIEAAARRGTSFGAPTEAESELAELIAQAMPSVEMVRLVNSGTEATMSAIRLARAYTGRARIVKFAGNYHGHVDSLLVAAGSSAATLGVPNSPGVTAGTAGDTLVLRYNDPEGLQSAFHEHGDRIAAVIVEPVVGNMGCVNSTPAFRTALRELTEKHGALLVFDEVMTGFRVAYGGAQAAFGMRPDLTTLGKIIGGGLPVGAYGGRADVMAHVAPAGPVYQAGTLSGNPLAVTAGLATLEALEQMERDEGLYARLARLGGHLADGIRRDLERLNLRLTLNTAGSMATLFFTDGAVRDFAAAARSDTQRYGRYFWEMLRRGIYLAPSQFEACFISAVHTEADLELFLKANYEALKVAFEK